jgi:uroporphyrinogen-III synthase
MSDAHSAVSMPGGSLSGKVVALPEWRELEVFAALLERRGATVWRCPLIAIIDAPDPQPVLAWCRLLIDGAAQVLVLLTGEGLRRILRLLDQRAPELRAPFIAAVTALTRVTRGPKPARALRELGLQPDLAAGTPTTGGIIAALRTLPLNDRRIALQLYGDDPNPALRQFLRASGATTLCVAPYRYATAAADERVRQMLAEIAAGRIDAIAFSSKNQVQRLAQLAGAAELRSTLQHCEVAAMGPVVAGALAELGISVGVMPASQWFMKPLTAELQTVFSNTSAADSR